MKKKYLLVVLAILLVGSAAGSGAWYWRRSHDYLGAARAAMARGDLRTAQIALRTMVRDRPQSAEAHYRLGAVQLQLGNPVAAERELKLAQTGGWNNHAVMPLLARAYLAQGRFKEVKDLSVEGLAPAEAGPLLVTRALAELGLKEVPQAQEAAAEAERLVPNIGEAPLAAARVALVRDDPDAAELKIDRALEIDPRSVDALVLKGQLQHSRGKYDAAVAAFTKALAIAPDAINIRLERANSLIALNQGQKAREDVDAVLKVDARNPLANYFLTVLLARAGDWKGANAALENISTVLSRFPRGEYFQALVKINVDLPAQATDAAIEYVARTPKDIAGYKLLASIYARTHQPRQMIPVLTNAMDAGLVDVELLEMLGTAYIQTGQTGLALQTLDKAARLASDNSAVLARIAAIRLGIGDAGGAEINLARSLELTPDKAGLGEQLVMAALAAGDVDRASAELEKLRQQPNNDPAKIGNLLGLVRLGQLDLDGARAAFEGVLAANPNANAAQLNLAKVLVLQGHGADAEKLLLAMLDKAPANVPALSAISGILLAEHKTDQLVALMEAARKAAPNNIGLTVVQADLLARTGETRKAYDLINALPKDQAGRPGVLLARARLQQALGMEKEAQDTYRQALVANPGDVNTRRQLADLLERAKDANGAKAVLLKGLEVSPGNLALLQSVVEVDFRSGGLDAALATAADLAKDTANLPAARLLKGELYTSVKRYADAAAAYQAESEREPLHHAGGGDRDRAQQRRPADRRAACAAGLAAAPTQGRRCPPNAVLARPAGQPHGGGRGEPEGGARPAAERLGRPEQPGLDLPVPRRSGGHGRWPRRPICSRPARNPPTRWAGSSPSRATPRRRLLLLTQAVRHPSTDATIFYHLAVALNDSGPEGQGGRRY